MAKQTDSREAVRSAALARALAEVTQMRGEQPAAPATQLASGRARPFERWSWQAAELVAEIVATAERIATARAADGEWVTRAEGTWRVLDAIDRSRYCLSIADLARALDVSRQAAHALVHEVARAGYVELEANRDDRRILQVLLTPRGRTEINGVRSIESRWLARLLHGLDDRRMVVVTRVLRVIRERLVRDSRVLARRRGVR